MIEQITRHRLAYWLLFCLLAALVFFVRLLPIDLTPGRWPGPDLIVAIGFAWTLRRPDYLPVALFAVIMFLSDILFQRPPGLWAALSVVGLEFLRARAQFSREMPFPVEWAMVAAVLLAMVLGNRLILGLFMVGQPGIALDGVLLVMTVLVYPVVVALSAFLFGVRKMAPGAVDELGHRI